MLFFAETMILLGYIWGAAAGAALVRQRYVGLGEMGREWSSFTPAKGAALAKLQCFLDKGELAQKRAVFLEALGEAADGDADGIVMHAAG
jgi:hypothetical protein